MASPSQIGYPFVTCITGDIKPISWYLTCKLCDTKLRGSEHNQMCNVCRDKVKVGLLLNKEEFETWVAFEIIDNRIIGNATLVYGEGLEFQILGRKTIQLRRAFLGETGRITITTTTDNISFETLTSIILGYRLTGKSTIHL